MPIAWPHGLHHITAIARDPATNLRFYTEVLGLRLVKRTVNYDDADTYHLYYGNESGEPSTLLTFFWWPTVSAGRLGNGIARTVAFSVPADSIGWWHERLASLSVEVLDPVDRGGEETIMLRDPEGLLIELVGTSDDGRVGWDGVAEVPAESAIHGLHSVSIAVSAPDATAAVLTEVLGMRLESDVGGRARFAMGAGGPGTIVDLVPGPRMLGAQGAGTVHHIALRAPDELTQVRWRDGLIAAGAQVTEIKDRYYFRSIYFREPGGILLEIASEHPGFTVDEPLLELGKRLSLPPWMEPNRQQIARRLPGIEGWSSRH